MPPLIAGRYLLQARLGSPGAQGEVYRALDTYEGDTVALKLLTSVPAGGPWMEAQILRRLVDPHILPIRNADLHIATPFLVTELAVHGTLESQVAATGSCGLTVDDVIRWTRQTCQGAARGHDLRLLHNDIKPGNLFLNAQQECLVGDFGMATLIPPGASGVIPYGATAETAAPEVAAGWQTPALTASVLSDVYSIGATAYWLLAGRPAHDLTSATDVLAKMRIVASQAPPRLRDLAPHVPQYVAAVIERAMARIPADRIESATALAAALGNRPAVSRNWVRTDEHPGHIACWRGIPANSGSTYVLCLEAGSQANRRVVAARHASSGKAIKRGSGGSIYTREWPRAIRTAIKNLS